MWQPGLFSSTICLFSLLATAECNPECAITDTHREKILDNYLNIWNGELSVVDQTLAPDVTLQIDRFPAGSHGTVDLAIMVNSSDAFAAFVKSTRSSMKSYKIIARKTVDNGRYIAARWTMKGIIGKQNPGVPTTVKPGDGVTYHGTDFLTLDPCTGLVTEVDIAQDLLTFLYNLGEDINLTPRKSA